MANIKVGVIGYGYWGVNIVRNFFPIPGCELKKVGDASADRLKLLGRSYPTVIGVTDASDLLNDPEIDAIVIATKVFSHFELAKKALLNGKHVLIEKPMTSSVAEAEELINLAEQKGLTLMVDHTFLYTGAIQRIKKMMQDDIIGKPCYFDSIRINLGLFQPDVNVLWDLAPHDISILTYLFPELPVSVNATGISHTGNGIENIAYMTLNYSSDFIAHFTCSWTSPVKLRHTLIGGDKKMILYNDLEPTDKVRLYDTGYQHSINAEDATRIMVDYRTGDVFLPKLNSQEPLSAMASDFIQSISEKRQPIANPMLGMQVVRILEASQRSIKAQGKEEKI
jgi:predicted dehydrogenase